MHHVVVPSTCSSTQEAQKDLCAPGPKGLKPTYYSILTHKWLHLFVTQHLPTYCIIQNVLSLYFPQFFELTEVFVLFMPENHDLHTVGIATGYGLDSLRIESRWRQDLPHLSRPALRPTQPPVQWVPGLSRG